MKIKTLEEILGEIRKIENPLPPDKRLKQSIKKLADGQIIRIKGIAYKVVEKNKYREKKWEWYEYKLFSLADGATIFLEWEEDDILEVSIYDRFISFNDTGLTKKDLDIFDDDEKGDFVFQGELFRYDESDQAVYHKAMAKEGDEFYYWSFESKDGKKYLSVEKWDEEYEVCLGYPVDPADIEIITG